MTLHNSTVCSPPSVFHNLPRPTANTEIGEDHEGLTQTPSDAAAPWGTHMFLGEVPRVKPHPQVDLSHTGGKAA